jgi:hypothetical protein
LNVIKACLALVMVTLGAALPASGTVAGATSTATIATIARPHFDSAAQLERRWGSVVASEHLRQPARLPMASGVTYQPPKRQRAHVNYGDMDEVGHQGSIGQCQCYAWQRLFDALYFTARGVHTRLSCRMQYALTQKPPGSDQGSYFAQYVTLTKDIGWVTTATYDYYGLPNKVPKKVPAKVLQAAQPHRYAVEVKTIARAVGGMNAVYGVMHAIAGGRQVNVAAPVFEGPGANSFYDIETHNGCIDLPGPKATDGGGHATAFYGYDMAAKPKDCSGCYLLAVNSWGKTFGVGRDGNAAPPGKRGYYKMSCRFAAQHAWGLESITTSYRPPEDRGRGHTRPGEHGPPARPRRVAGAARDGGGAVPPPAAPGPVVGEELPRDRCQGRRSGTAGQSVGEAVRRAAHRHPRHAPRGVRGQNRPARHLGYPAL